MNVQWKFITILHVSRVFHYFSAQCLRTLVHLGTSLKNSGGSGIGVHAFATIYETSVSTFTLFWNGRPSKFCFSAPNNRVDCPRSRLKWLQQLLYPTCAVRCYITVLMKNHTSRNLSRSRFANYLVQSSQRVAVIGMFRGMNSIGMTPSVIQKSYYFSSKLTHFKISCLSANLGVSSAL
jgi:hypothetical protein